MLIITVKDCYDNQNKIMCY